VGEIMIVTRHISLDNDCIQKMEPYVEKHKGNFSAAIREIIDRAGKNSELENISTIDNTLFKWMLNETDGLLVPDNVLDDLIDPMLINSMGKLEDHLKRKFSELEWDVDLSLKYDNDALPSDVLIEVKGAPQKIRFVARMLAQFLVKNSPEQVPLEISSVFNLDGGIRIELSKSNKKEAFDSLVTSFGGLNEVISAIKSRPVFWKSIINGHLLSNYNMVTVHRNYFEDLLSGKVPMGEITIETLAKKPIQEIPLREMLSLIKEVYETSRVVDRVEIDRENLILFHNYRNKDVIEKLRTSIVTLLEANGHLYDAKSTANMVVLTHRPDVGIKINEIVSNLKISNSRVDQDLIMFMAFLKGLKNIPDIPVSLTALGKRIGISLMQEYEKENNIKNWEHQNFQKALEIIDSKLHRESEWKSEGKNLLYTVKKCNIVAEGNTFDTYICHTIRETFKGAMSYAYGSKAELDIKKLLSHGDNCCEVLIRVP
jgi:predicted hydrocarbon binding protein